MKKIISIFLSLTIILGLSIASYAQAGENNNTENDNLDLSVESACLMEASTGKILYAENLFTELSLASVTKIMTLLLVCEALDRGSFTLDEKVSISSYAASMGGSQVFLEEGERITVEELIKCAVIASANDAAVALAELVAGNESAFVNKMNTRAKELGLSNSHFENTTGLDDTTTSHYSSAKDIAVMSKELIKHPIILKYSGIWQDTIRGGEFTLTNTNRLVRYYDGCNGLKTGSTDKAGYCVSATAKRGNMQLIAVVMGAKTRDARNNAAKALLDYGFSSFALYEKDEELIEKCDVRFGKILTADLYSKPISFLVKREKLNAVEEKYQIPEFINAPLSKGDTVGSLVYSLDGETLAQCDIYVGDNIEKITFLDIFIKIIKRITQG